MKPILALLLSLSFLISDTNLIASIDKTLQKVIQESRNKKLSDIQISYDPFNNNNKSKFITSPTKKSTNYKQPRSQKQFPSPVLSMIFNKNAFINGKWYKENEKFVDYRVIKINQDIVILKKNNKYTTLRIPLSDNILVTTEEIQ